MKSIFQTYNEKSQHFNVSENNFPLLAKYLKTIDASSYQYKPFEPTDEGIRTVVKKAHSDYFGRPYSEIKLPYSEFEPLVNEYIKGVKFSNKPNYIPIIIRSNGYRISISPE